jgi:hypothetical protein
MWPLPATPVAAITIARIYSTIVATSKIPGSILLYCKNVVLIPGHLMQVHTLPLIQNYTKALKFPTHS